MQQLLQWISNKYYIFWVCVCSLRYRTCNAHATYWNLWPAMLYNICQHSHKRSDFQKINLLNTKVSFDFLLQLLSETFLTLRRTEWSRVKYGYWSSCKVHVILVRFEWDMDFLNRFYKNIQIPNFVTNRPVGAEFFHADRRTERHDEAISRFSIFTKASKK